MHMLCTICSDLLNQAENIYVTKCGHMFHYHCLSQWIERSKSCPQCRNKVTERCMFRLYPTVSNEMTGDDAATLQSRLDDTKLQLRQQKQVCTTLENNIKTLTENLKKNETTIASLEQKLVGKVSTVKMLNEKLLYMQFEVNEVKKLREENESLKKDIQMLQGLDVILSAVTSDVESMLKGYADARTLATFATALKRALCESESKKIEFRNRLYATQREMAQEKVKYTELQAKMVELEDKLANALKRSESLENEHKKRKATEMDSSKTENVLNTQKKARQNDSLNPNTAASPGTSCSSGDTSVNSMVKRIATANSPYLILKQSSLALSALNRAPLRYPAERIKPTDYALLTSKLPVNENKNSIFLKKAPISEQVSEKHDMATYDISYDGLGGHSKLDVFPTPKPKPVKGIPKLTAKHKLKKPVSSGSQDIGKIFDDFCRSKSSDLDDFCEKK